MEYESFIAHEGKAHDENPPGRGSGRYPFGSGNRPHQHDWDLISRYDKLVATTPGIKNEEIARELGFYKTDRYGHQVFDDDGNPIGYVTKLKAAISMAGNNIKKDQYEEICWYDNHLDPDTGKHYTDTKIAQLMGLPGESSVRSKRDTVRNGKKDKFLTIADKLKEECDAKGVIDVTKDVSKYLDCSQDDLSKAIISLQDQGYVMKKLNYKNMTNPNFEVNVTALCKPDEDIRRLFKEPERVKAITPVEESMQEKSHDNDIDSAALGRGVGKTPQIALNRIKIRYGDDPDDPGVIRDGLIELRAVRDQNGKLVAACPDLSIGNARYAQVRIAVEGDKYIKGMAVYNEDLPEGCDIRVNSNKPMAKGVDGALKNLEKNQDGTLAKNMFGSAVVQTVQRDQNGEPLRDKNGNQIASAINLVGADMDDAHVEGRWGRWSKNIPAQAATDFPVAVTRQQLQLQAKIHEEQYQEIMAVNNPSVRRNLLIDFADQMDAAACDLKAAPIGGQKTRVLLPVPSLKDNECYAPGLDNGTTVAVIRFPHQGKWETAILKVNNNNPEGKKMFGDGADAIGLNHQVHGILSGADSDGDTGIVIPMTRKNKSTGEFEKVVDIENMPSLEGRVKTDDSGGFKKVKISDFDPTAEYGIDNPRFSSMVNKNGNPTYPYFKTESAKGKEMGIASNLLQDMRSRGCDNLEELCRADMYSMVVIDAKKHKLNYQQAYKDFGIEELKHKYQAHLDATTGEMKFQGASTMVTLASSPSPQPIRSIWKPSEKSIDPETGKKIYDTPYKTTEMKATGPEYVKIPGKNRYLRDENGEKIQATWTGEVKQREDGSYYYEPGTGKGKWEYKERERTEKIPKMNLVDNAYDLIHPDERIKMTPMDRLYADYANHEKALANNARKQWLQEKPIEYNKEAAAKYTTEVKELKAALKQAEQNAPRERQAQFLATSEYNAILNDRGSSLDSEDKRKLRGQCVSDARRRCGALKERVKFTEKQWEAINAGAIHPSTLDKLLRNADKDNYMSLALPKTKRISDAQKIEILTRYSDKKQSYEEIAEAMNISTGSVANVLSDKSLIA